MYGKVIFEVLRAAILSILTLVVIFSSTGQSLAEPACEGDAAWISSPGTFDGTEPSEPEEECPFYQRSWQAFLHVTANDGDKPAFLKYATYGTTFGGQPGLPAKEALGTMSLAVRTPEEPGPVFDGGINQALSSAVIDKNGNPIFFAVEIDPVMSSFITGNSLNQVCTLRDPTVTPEITDGAIEIKSAWQVIEDPTKFDTYLKTTALVPALVQDGAKVRVDTSVPPVSRPVALLGIHVVFKLANHPELIWATFEHVDGTGEFDLVPRAVDFPGAVDPMAPVSASGAFTLYQPNTTYALGNSELQSTTLDGTGHITERSSIYRAFPYAQAQENGAPPEPDEDVTDLNNDMASLLATADPNDVRRNYRLLGTVWVKEGAKDFHPGTRISDDKLIGERGLSNAAIESLTQENFPHCFSCHQPLKKAKIPAKSLSVSHLFVRFSDESTTSCP